MITITKILMIASMFIASVGVGARLHNRPARSRQPRGRPELKNLVELSHEFAAPKALLQRR